MGVLLGSYGGGRFLVSEVPPVQGYLAHKKHPPPLGRPQDLGMGPLLGPREELFRVSEVPPVGRTTICSQVDIPRLWYTPVNFGVDDNFGVHGSS